MKEAAAEEEVEEDRRDTESKTRTPHKDVGNNQQNHHKWISMGWITTIPKYCRGLGHWVNPT